MHSLLISLIMTVLLLGCANAKSPADDYTLYLVRHAEKEVAGTKDPGLTTAGKSRSDKLASDLQNKGVEDIWSSDYQRTRNTAAPLATQLDLEVRIYNPRELESLVEVLKQRHNNALVVGHSNTTPELARLLCQCPVPDMDESEYDRLLIITMQEGKASLVSLVQ